MGGDIKTWCHFKGSCDMNSFNVLYGASFSNLKIGLTSYPLIYALSLFLYQASEEEAEVERDRDKRKERAGERGVKRLLMCARTHASWLIITDTLS